MTGDLPELLVRWRGAETSPSVAGEAVALPGAGERTERRCVLGGGAFWWGRALLQIEIANDDRRPQRIHVVSRFLRTFNALGAPQQVLFKRLEGNP